ncbi:MAG: DUF4402 domain-containing protein [Peptostreptococcaceae bacterium]
MKKLLTLLSLTLSMTAFAAPQGNDDVNGNMNVTARVIAPLTITQTGDLAFGNIIKGKSADATSSYSITGEGGAGINFTISETLELTHDTRSNEKLIVQITPTIPTNLNDDGTASLGIAGVIDIPENQLSGSYSGTLVAAVRYN